MTVTKIDILKAARELIADPARWTQGVFSRDKNGEPCFGSGDSVAWCALGAFSKVQQDFQAKANTPDECREICRERCDAEDALRQTIGTDRDGDARITFVNDTLGHAAIIAFFDKAIAGK